MKKIKKVINNLKLSIKLRITKILMKMVLLLNENKN